MTQPYEVHLRTYLQNASSGDTATRDQAEAGIQQLQAADWGSFIAGLAQEIANESAPEVGRQMAGLLLKNALDAKDPRLQVWNVPSALVQVHAGLK
jgi:importin subunit beta-1